MKKKSRGPSPMLSGYMTVEAALVFPVVLGVVFFIVMDILFQYDRCVIEQNLGMLALEGARIQGKKEGELAEHLKRKAVELEGLCLLWQQDPVKIEVKTGSVSLRQTGKFLVNQQREFVFQRSYRNKRVNPGVTIRVLKRFGG